MLEGVVVVLHVLVVVVGVGEKVVVVCEYVGGGEVAFGEEDLGWVFDGEEFFFVVVEQPALFVAQVDGDFFVAFDFDGMVDADGAVVGSDDDVDVVGGEFFECFGEWGVLEPGEGDGAVAFFVLGEFADDVGVGSGVGKHVDEVVDDDVEGVVHQVGDGVDKAFAVLCVEDFVVGVFDVEAVPAEVFVEELVFELVFVAFFVFVDPVLGIFFFDFGGHESAEHGVSGELGGGGDDAVEEGVLFGVEVLFDGGLEEFPLVVAEVVDED